MTAMGQLIAKTTNVPPTQRVLFALTMILTVIMLKVTVVAPLIVTTIIWLSALELLSFAQATLTTTVTAWLIASMQIAMGTLLVRLSVSPKLHAKKGRSAVTESITIVMK
jgi:hypothetical protein